MIQLLKGITADIVDEGQRITHSYSYHSSHPCQYFSNLPVTSTQSTWTWTASVFNNIFFSAHKSKYTGHQPWMSHPISLSAISLIRLSAWGPTVPLKCRRYFNEAYFCLNKDRHKTKEICIFCTKSRFWQMGHVLSLICQGDKKFHSFILNLSARSGNVCSVAKLDLYWVCRTVAWILFTMQMTSLRLPGTTVLAMSLCLVNIQQPVIYI